MTESILTCVADPTNPSVESKLCLWLPQAGLKVECLTLEPNLMVPPTQNQKPTILNSTATTKSKEEDTTNSTPAGNMEVEDSTTSIPSSHFNNTDHVFDDKDNDGVERQQQDNTNVIHSLRLVDTTCSICLERYKIGDTVCWSSNTVCCHVFHLHCIVHWLMTTSSSITSPNTTPRVLYETTTTTTTTNATSEDAADDDGAPTSDIEQDVSSTEAYSCPCCRACFIDTSSP